MSITKSELDLILENLYEVPEPSDNEKLLSKREIKNQVRPVIASLKRKGYTNDQIFLILENSGLDATKNLVKVTAKNYRRNQSKTQKTKQPKTKQPKNKNEKKPHQEKRSPSNFMPDGSNFKPMEDIENI